MTSLDCAELIWFLLRGITYSLRPTQIAYVLPGSGYVETDLHSVSEAADKACSDEKLMELAWEVWNHPELYI